MITTATSLDWDHCDCRALDNINITGDLPSTLTGMTSLIDL